MYFYRLHDTNIFNGLQATKPETVPKLTATVTGRRKPSGGEQRVATMAPNNGIDLRLKNKGLSKLQRCITSLRMSES